jgi:predicted site-specific integrase-resolvase
MNDKNKKLWTSTEVASFYACSLSTLAEWRKKRLIPFIRLVNGAYRYDMEEVRKHVEKVSNARGW